jgi:hypothetical protein
VGKAVKKAVSLPAEFAAEVEALREMRTKLLSAVVQDALRALKRSPCTVSYGSFTVTGQPRLLSLTA